MNQREDAITVSHTVNEGQQNVSVSTTSAQTANAIGSEECLVYSTVECFAKAGPNPTATATTGTPIPANTLIRLKGYRSQWKIAFITASGTGTVYVRPGA